MSQRMSATLQMLLLGLILSGGPRLLNAGDWPAFRGPAGNGLSDESGLPAKWSPSENVKWKVALPAGGNGSPIVSGGRGFTTYAEDKGRERSLVCYDRRDGRELWGRTVKVDRAYPTHNTNPYAGSTPVADGKHVVVWHSSGGLYCYDFAGREVWKRDLGEFIHMWGYGTSPVLHEGRVLLHSGPGRRVFMAALSLETGKTVWEQVEPQEGNGERNPDNKYMGSWSAPLLANVAGKWQVIVGWNTRVVGYDVNTGAILWTCDGLRGRKGDLCYSTPLVADDTCVVFGGFNGPAFAFKLGGTGDVSDTKLWATEPSPQSIGSGVFLGKHIYRPNAGGPTTIECLEAETGKVLWSQKAGTYWSSIVSGDGHLYVTSQSGTTTVFEPSPDGFKKIAVNALGERTNSTPALSDGNIFLQTYEHLYCIE
ncbi:MAG: serine/threonine protein kinase [Planctomycetaceae bacterium]|nr:serine/threonine protein kinase [Planctomycetaceae bacterium]